ncbi:hypothetical protein CRG98_007337 [Punica granatum]|uniref:CCHC-type domain-containing protein n=1 Tax=Punica granatum TaxID=22663 RepID=A0A2I0KV89_PUNGR|nr:hypothetical protein CRG98_007337 [Punica granatum]
MSCSRLHVTVYEGTRLSAKGHDCSRLGTTVREGTRLFLTGRDYSRLDATVKRETGHGFLESALVIMKSMNSLSCIPSDNWLTGPNFSDWLRNLNIVLNMEALRYILKTHEIELPGGDATSDQQDAYDQWSVDDTKNAMNNKRKDKEVVLMVGTSSSKIGKKKKKSKKCSLPQQSTGVTKKKGKTKVAADKGTCFHCGKDGHWKRNCSQYLASLKANKGKKPSEGTPQLNGVSEMRNRTLLDMVRSMMSYTDLPISMRGYALQIACYLLNRIPSKSVSTTPYEIWNSRIPSLKHVKIWGCPALIKKKKTDKLETQSEKGRDDPSSYEDIDSFKWLEAMKSEIESMSENQVRDLVDPLEGIVPIGNKWIGADGKVETYKAKLVAKGYRQRQRVDYEETFSPVAMLKSIRIMLAIAAHYDYEVWQMDVKTAFLNGHIEEDIFID